MLLQTVRFSLVILAALLWPATSNATSQKAFFRCVYHIFSQEKPSVPRVSIPSNWNPWNHQGEVLAALHQAYPKAQVVRTARGQRMIAFVLRNEDGSTFCVRLPIQATDRFEGALVREERAFKEAGEAGLPTLNILGRITLTLPSHDFKLTGLVTEGSALGSLKDNLVDLKPRSAKDSLERFLALSETLDKFHSQAFILGDIKPANILVFPTESGQPRFRFIDFLAPSQIAPDRAMPRTKIYLTKETLTSGRQTTQADDVRALKLTFLEMATGIELREIVEDAFIDTIRIKAANGDDVLYLDTIPEDLIRNLAPEVQRILKSEALTAKELEMEIRTELNRLSPTL